MALYYLFLTSIDPHLKSGRSLVQGVATKYHGERKVTRLESTISGNMRDFITDADRILIVNWLNEGAKQDNYGNIESIIQNSCATCHSPEGDTEPMLTRYEDVHMLAESDLGVSILQLSKVSHVHLFGMAFIFILTGVIFSFCDISERIKVIVVLLPFAAILIDIGSWWLTHTTAVFAYTVICGGALMSLSFALQLLLPLYQMWVPARKRDRTREIGRTDTSD